MEMTKEEILKIRAEQRRHMETHGIEPAAPAEQRKRLEFLKELVAKSADELIVMLREVREKQEEVGLQVRSIEAVLAARTMGVDVAQFINLELEVMDSEDNVRLIDEHLGVKR